jgi:hypothetical protein
MADDKVSASEQEFQNFLRLLMRHWNSIGRELEDSKKTMSLLLCFLRMKQAPRQEPQEHNGTEQEVGGPGCWRILAICPLLALAKHLPTLSRDR